MPPVRKKPLGCGLHDDNSNARRHERRIVRNVVLVAEHDFNHLHFGAGQTEAEVRGSANRILDPTAHFAPSACWVGHVKARPRIPHLACPYVNSQKPAHSFSRPAAPTSLHPNLTHQ